MSRLDPDPAEYVTDLPPGSVIQICGLDPEHKKYFGSGHRLRRTSEAKFEFLIFYWLISSCFSLFFRQVHRGDRFFCHGDSITREEKILGLVCWLSLQCMHIQNSCVYCTWQQPSFSTRLLLTCRLFQTSKWVVGPRDAIATVRTSPTPSRGSTGTIFKLLYKLDEYRIFFWKLYWLYLRAGMLAYESSTIILTDHDALLTNYEQCCGSGMLYRILIFVHLGFRI